MRHHAALLIAILLLFLATASAADPRMRIVVSKSRRQLLLLKDGEVFRRYRVSLGRSPTGSTKVLGDMKIPVGRYCVYEKRADEETKYQRFLAIQYPELADTDVALAEERTSVDVWPYI